MADLRKVSKKELLETFDKFLLAVDFRIEHLKYATKDNSYNWDFSLKNLDSLENFILINKYGVLLSPYEELGLFIFRKKKGMIANNIEMIINPPSFY